MPRSTSRRGVIRRAWPCAVLTCALLGCDATALRLLVVAELAVPSDTDELVVTVTANDEAASSRYPLEGSAPSLSESLTLLPGERMRDELRIDVDAVKGARRVASGGGAAAFRAGAVEELIVTLERIAPGDDGGVPNEETDAGQRVDAGPRRCLDADGDGYGDGSDCLGLDCDESDDEVHAGASEECNDVDDDCDFAIDEGCSCSLADNRSCGTLTGECSIGWQTCASAEWGECDSATLPEAEVCNGDDDDCDGDVDEGCP